MLRTASSTAICPDSPTVAPLPVSGIMAPTLIGVRGACAIATTAANPATSMPIPRTTGWPHLSLLIVPSHVMTYTAAFFARSARPLWHARFSSAAILTQRSSHCTTLAHGHRCQTGERAMKTNPDAPRQQCARPLRAPVVACALLAMAALLALVAAHAADPWPNRPLRMVIPFAPGGTTDLIGRMVAEGLSRALGQPVVVENKAGAGGNLGATDVARAPPDGYTLMMGTPG